MKSSAFILTLSLLAVFFRLPVYAQEAPPSHAVRHRAELLIKKGAGVDRKPVVISRENGVLKIQGVKDAGLAKSFADANIKSISYSYSDKPQIKEAILTSLLLNSWLMGIPFFFTQTKKHWLVLNTNDEALLFELPKSGYRRFLFEMSAGGFDVEDLGDRDGKEELLPRPKAPADFAAGASCGESF